MLKKLIALSFLLSCSVYSAQDISPEVLKKALEGDGGIKAVESLPIETLKIVEGKDGQVYFISGNGRFVFKGVMFDVWKKQSIDTVEDAKTLRYLPIESMGASDDELAIFKVGNPNIPRQGYIILDPTSPKAKGLFEEIMNNQGDYHLDILPIPVLQGAHETIKNMWCAKDKNAGLNALVYQQNTELKIKENCDTEPLFRNIALFSLLDVKSVPVVIREDGYQLTGIPKNLKSFLDDNTNKDKKGDE